MNDEQQDRLDRIKAKLRVEGREMSPEDRENHSKLMNYLSQRVYEAIMDGMTLAGKNNLSPYVAMAVMHMPFLAIKMDMAEHSPKGAQLIELVESTMINAERGQLANVEILIDQMSSLYDKRT